MNIFYLDPNPQICAEMHNDKHVVKMILEYAQLLSTAHRVLDGVATPSISPSGRNRIDYVLAKDIDRILYRATHINHPSAIWVRQSYKNYVWLHQLLHYLCKEYTFRYGKTHKVEREGLLETLYLVPVALEKTREMPFTQPTPAMPDEVKVINDSIASYRNYYNKNKTHLASWKGKVNSRKPPEWYNFSYA